MSRMACELTIYFLTVACFFANNSSVQADLILNEFLASPASGPAGDANGDGVRDFSDDEFVELINFSHLPFDLSGWSISDSVSVRHTFPARSVLASFSGIVVFGGGTPVGSFGGALVQTASAGRLSLNNTGDTITVKDAAGQIQLSVFYGSSANAGQSLNRSPELFGTFTKHSSTPNSGGTLFSPGTTVDGHSIESIVPEPTTFWLMLMGGLLIAGKTYRPKCSSRRRLITGFLKIRS